MASEDILIMKPPCAQAPVEMRVAWGKAQHGALTTASPRGDWR